MATNERDWWRARAPAKVNLWLEVVGRRPDGFHELDTGMLALEWSDELWLRTSERPGLRLELCGEAASPDVPDDERNLAVRALRAVLERVREQAPERVPAGIELRLVKQLPSRAGLGGGSSDAAAAAWVAHEALGAPLEPSALLELLARLGSDCAFFCAARHSGAARCRGRGEQVEVLAPPRVPWWLALVVPECGAQTAEVYRAWSSRLSAVARSSSLRSLLFACDADEARVQLFNDLEGAAALAVPELARWRQFLDRAGFAHFRLSGSGSAHFGLFRDAASAQAELDELVARARADGLALRAARVTRSAGQGAALIGRVPR